MSEFKVGDVVQAKSGGPQLTIASILPGGVLECFAVSDVHQFVTIRAPIACFRIKNCGQPESRLMQIGAP
jgi:hypothetical protein